MRIIRTPLGIEHDDRGVRVVYRDVVRHPSGHWHSGLTRDEIARHASRRRLTVAWGLIALGTLVGLTADRLDGAQLIASPLMIGAGGWGLIRAGRSGGWVR